MITQEELKIWLSYNKDTGEFSWLNKTNRNIVIGSRAGTYDSKGYLKISLFGNQYYGHRLAWLYIVGTLPAKGKIIDHIDNNPSNNRWENLREASYSQNNQNAKLSIRSTTMTKGVSFCNRTKRYKGTVYINNSQYHVGYFTSLQKAEEAVMSKRALLHKEFANYGYQ